MRAFRVSSSRIIARMRPALVAPPLTAAFAVSLTACLSGFSEIRVLRPDAGAADVVRLDMPAPPVDAPQRPTDALDVPAILDATMPLLDATEVAVAVDAGTIDDGPDVGPPWVDAPDAPGVDGGDSRELADAVGPDAFDAQCPTPLCNGVCVDTSGDRANCGRCGLVCPGRCLAGSCVRFAGVVPVVPRDRYQSTADPRAEWESLCRGMFPGSRVCRAVDVQDTPLHAEICAVVWPMRPKQSPSRAVAAVAETPRPMATPDGRTSYVCAECDYRGPLNGWVGGCFSPHAIACCSP